jgi:quinol monooxygenase YgiN
VELAPHVGVNSAKNGGRVVDMIIVTGSATARPGNFDEMLAVSLEHVHRSREEPGCVSHAVYHDVEHPLRVVFFEQWADRAALQAHFEVPESLTFVEALGRLTDQPPTMEIHTVAEG